LKVLTWKDLNPLILDWETQANSYISILYLIILAIAASVIINTLIMSVYERTREIGILSAIGMRGGRIMWLFLAESALLAVGGVIMGVILGMIGHLPFQYPRILYWKHGSDRLHGHRYDLRQDQR
jgi:putative ABC transport system permease protein